MKVLFDECVPKRFKRYLVGHDVATTPEQGWAGIKNGALLKLAASKFDVFLTVDKNLAFQQNVVGLPIPILVIDSVSNKLNHLIPFGPAILEMLSRPLERTVIHIKM